MDYTSARSKGTPSKNKQLSGSKPHKPGLLERLQFALTQDPWRSRLMAMMRLLGYRDEQWIRVVMGQKTEEMLTGVVSDHTQVLEISGLTWAKYFPPERYSNLSFPYFDICKQSTDKAYDLILLEQVLEHVLQPALALKNIEASLKKGGHVLVTTPFLVRYHGHPYDCSRWTETGLRQMLLNAGFDTEGVETGSWGNKSCLRSNLGVWQRYNPFIHSLANDPRYPLMVWALARKSGDTPGSREFAGVKGAMVSEGQQSPSLA